MITNLLVVAFVLMMAFYWYTQGLFSAFLHLAAVVIAGTLAFALWLPTAHWLLDTETVAAYYAWGVSLIGWFIACLVIVRMVLDRYVPGNVQFPNLVNLIAGAVCGLGSGVLTAGVAVIAIGFMPLPMSLGGYQPYNIGPDNRPQQAGGNLWIPVDHVAAGFFTRLSTGAFAPWGSSANLASHRPNLVVQSAMFRFRYDENASLVASPEALDITRLLEHPLPSDDLPADLIEAMGSRAEQSGQKLVVVETIWDQHPAGYDRGTIRIGQAQVQLLTDGDDAAPYFPVGFAKPTATGTRREFYPYRGEDVVAYNTSNEQVFAFAFVVPAGEEPAAVLLRQVRFPLAELAPVTEAEAVRAALGELVVVEEDDEDGDDEDGSDEARSEGPLVQTAELPDAFSKNYAPGSFDYDGTQIVSGSGEVPRHSGRLTERTRVDSIYHPSHQRLLRLEADIRAARSLLGQIRQTAERVHGITLEDSRGGHIEPVAYVWHKANGDQEIRVDLDRGIRSATELPRPASIGSDDELYLYFMVNPGVTIERYHLGPEESHEVDFTVE